MLSAAGDNSRLGRPHLGRLVRRGHFAGGVEPARGERVRAADESLSWILALLPAGDVVLAQVQAAFWVQLGPLTMPQAWHGLILLMMAAVLAARLREFPRGHGFALLAAGFFGAAIALSIGLRVVSGEVVLEDVVAGLQVAYWLLLWPCAIVICRTAVACRRVLAGIAAAGVYAAVSVIYCYISGNPDSSPYADIAASAGGLNTAKGLGGILIVGGLAAGWLFRERSRLLGVGALAICVGGLFLTYQRAGLVALGVVLLWLGVWYLGKGRRQSGAAWIGRLVCIGIVALVMLLIVIGISDLQERWKDLSNSAKAGSARLEFWQVAMDYYQTLGVTEKLSGISYAGLVETMQDIYGARIHAHNDVLDATIMFGLLGLAGLVLVHAAVLRAIWAGRARSPLFAISVGVYLTMLSESILTGQMFAPHVMALYLAAVVCWSKLSELGEGGVPRSRRLMEHRMRPGLIQSHAVRRAAM